MSYTIVADMNVPETHPECVAQLTREFEVFLHTSEPWAGGAMTRLVLIVNARNLMAAITTVAPLFQRRTPVTLGVMPTALRNQLDAAVRDDIAAALAETLGGCRHTTTEKR